MADLPIKDKITYAALDLFSQKGYDSTTVDEIADAVGMKGPNLYYYFKKKEDILQNIASIADVPYQGMFGYDNDAPIWIHNGEELKEFSWFLVKHTMDDELTVKLRKFCTIEQFRDSEVIRKLVDHQYEVVLNLYIKLFSDMIKNGKAKDCNPNALALQFTAPISILIQLSDRQPNRRDEAMDMMNKHMDSFIDTYIIKE